MTLEQEILGTYDHNPVAVYSINQISKRVGKSYPYINKKVHALIDQGILNRKETGRSHLCSINFSNKHAIMLLALNELEKHADVPEDAMQLAKELDAAKHEGPINALVYDPTTNQLLVIAPHAPRIDAKHQHLTTDELRKRLLADEDFYARRVVISGHEHFFSLLATPEIQRRYHPLL